MSLLLGIGVTSPKQISVGDDIPNSWVMFKKRTFTNPCLDDLSSDGLKMSWLNVIFIFWGITSQYKYIYNSLIHHITTFIVNNHHCKQSPIWGTRYNNNFNPTIYIYIYIIYIYMGGSWNRGTPKSFILVGFSLINHPFWGTPIFGNLHIIPIHRLNERTIPKCWRRFSVC